MKREATGSCPLRAIPCRAAVALFVCLSSAFGQTMSEVTVFEGGRDGYHTYRIPAILGATDGALLAFCEGRTHNAADTGDIDIVLRRSTDEGRTWGPLILAVDYGPHTAGNPSPILDRRTGRIVLLFNQDFVQDDQTAIQNGTSTATRSAWVCYSDNHGLSWSRPLEITDQVKLPDWRWLAFGPAHGIQLQRGPHAGRLLVGVVQNGPNSNGAFGVFSDDTTHDDLGNDQHLLIGAFNAAANRQFVGDIDRIHIRGTATVLRK